MKTYHLLLTALLVACTPSDLQWEDAVPGNPHFEGWDLAPGAREIVVSTTIQAAIDSAARGDVILVPAGTWHEELYVNQGVSIIGTSRDETTLVGSVTVEEGQTEVTVASMSILSPTWVSSGAAHVDPYGIKVSGGDVTFFYDLRIQYFQKGFFADYTGGGWIWESEISHNWFGVYGYGCSGFRVYSCLITSNPGAGVRTQYIDPEYETYVVNNTLVGNGFGGASEPVSGAIALYTNSRELVANNIIVSNARGIDCDSCRNLFDSNLVWGNAVDYSGDASASATDLSTDPLFVDATEGDYHLSPTSPCIDAGISVPVPRDHDGQTRPQGAAYDLGYDEFVSSGYDLLLTEVLANPTRESTGEFVEIYNASGGTVDLAGLKVGDGGDLDILTAYSGGTTSLAVGAYAVVVDPDYTGAYGIGSGVTVVTTTDTTLGNGLTTADRVTLYESDGTTVIATFTHPSDPGDGVSLEMVDLSKGDISGNWRASACPDNMSPGADHCFPPSGNPGGLVITEVMANALDEVTGEFVEVYNPTTTEIDLAGLVIADNASSDILVGYQGGSTLVGPSDHALIVDPDLVDAYFLPAGIVLVTTSDATIGNGLSNASDSVTLYKSDATTVIDSYSFRMDPGNGVSVEKRNYAGGDVGSNWIAGDSNCGSGHSVGRLNGATGGRCEALLITEVMANALDEDTGEFVEIYNAGLSGAELDGLVITDGDALDYLVSFAGGNSFLEAGAYALVLDVEYAGEYDIVPGTILMRTLDTTLGNSLAVTDSI
ncbi:MAG: lamin tail domain-containing protein, partial [Deltaproteobacteria bacterium]|nr:lamin tail domain-containing protein [Deltaproteobacteria bacterium]